MRMLVFAIICITVVMIVGRTEATTLAGSIATNRPGTAPIKKVECTLPGGTCPWGRKHACHGMVCSCVPCGGIWRLWHR
jgi:hypothetical protein